MSIGLRRLFDLIPADINSIDNSLVPNILDSIGRLNRHSEHGAADRRLLTNPTADPQLYSQFWEWFVQLAQRSVKDGICSRQMLQAMQSLYSDEQWVPTPEVQRIQELESQVTRLQDDTVRLGRVNAEWSTVIARLRAEVQTLTANNRHLNLDRDAWRRLAERRQEEETRLQAKLKEEETRLQAKIGRLEEDLVRSRDTVTERDLLISGLQTQVEELRRQRITKLYMECWCGRQSSWEELLVLANGSESALAAGYVAVLYSVGDFCGIGQDIAQAEHFGRTSVPWLREHTERSEMCMYAQYVLGALYEHGAGIEKDVLEAVRCYRLAAQQGHADAENRLGYCFQKGEVVSRDLEHAVHWYRLAANQGHPYAQFRLGYCVQKGEGVNIDLEQAVHWYRLAANQGLAVAQFRLGYCFQKGEGVNRDLEQAVHWYRRAAEQGDAHTQRDLGYCFQKGEGMDEDLEQAVRWYRLAARQYTGSNQI